MTANVGTIDRILRLVIGIALIIAGYYSGQKCSEESAVNRCQPYSK